MRDVCESVAIRLVHEPILKLIDLVALKRPIVCSWSLGPNVNAGTRWLGVVGRTVNLVGIFDTRVRVASSGALVRIRCRFDSSVTVVPDFHEVLGTLRHLRIECRLPSHMCIEILWLAAIRLAGWCVERGFQEHVIHLRTEVQPSEANVDTSCDPVDPCVLQVVGRRGPVEGEWQEPYHLLASADLVDDTGSTRVAELGKLPSNGRVGD